MNWLDKLVTWLRGSTPAAQPTIGDRLLSVAADYLKAKSDQAKEKANAANAAAPADNAPGATVQASEPSLGQSLSDLLKANGQ